MTRRLILMRHAKSSWKDGDVSDHDRKLNGRGRRSADAMGPWLAERGYVPGAVLSSSSARTLETWARIAPHLARAPEATVLSSLYLATPQTLLDVLRGAQAPSVAMLAHNPGIAAFADMLVSERPGHADFARYPTLATLVADFDIEDWAELAPGTGRVVDFLVPRELTD
jgi:phosphohistidine phosphatase